MLTLMRDWLLDPTALLFLASLLTCFVLIVAQIRRCRAVNSVEKQKRGRHVKERRPWFFLSLVTVCTLIFLFLLSSAPVLVNPLVIALEQFEAPEDACAVGSHVVVLGGGVSSRAQSKDDFYQMQPATFVRATHAARLMLAEPKATLIVAGGAMRDISEADVISEYLVALGIPRHRMLLEAESSNTRENAVNVAELLLGSEVEGPVRLITSALHMHRALRSFQQVLGGRELSVCPVRVDAQGIENVPLFALMPQTTALLKFDLLVHELLALLVYRLKGWI